METRRKTTAKRGVRVLLIAAAVMVLGVVAAASPQIFGYINMKFLKEDSAARLTEVPEDYIGIYTAEDLDNVRNDVYANYILMNDIVITEEDYAEGGIFEGGFEPIGVYHGTFNGNGYVIDGLVINVVVDEAYADTNSSLSYTNIGLFGRVQRWSDDRIIVTNENVMKETELGMDLNGDGDTDDELTSTSTSAVVNEDAEKFLKGGIVKNLGLVNGSVTVEKTAYREIMLGAIAGHADFIVGCYTENFTVSLINRSAYADNSIGGIVGKAEYVDSCYTDALITYTLEVPEGEEYFSGNTGDPYIGGVAGQTYACATSYFNGEINADKTEFDEIKYVGDNGETESEKASLNIDGVANIPEGAVPAILSDSIMTKLSETLGEFHYRKFLAFYQQSSHYNELEISPEGYTTDNTIRLFYVLDPTVLKRELRELSNILKDGFKDESFEVFCGENNIKYGKYACYDLREPGTCTFDGFDLENIWIKREHENPTLRLFSGGSDNIRPTPDERPTIGWNKGIDIP